MKYVRELMLLASLIGALFGVNIILIVHPGMDLFYWVGAFAILGIGVSNLVLLILYKIYVWMIKEEQNVNSAV